MAHFLLIVRESNRFEGRRWKAPRKGRCKRQIATYNAARNFQNSEHTAGAAQASKSNSPWEVSLNPQERNTFFKNIC
jgi:hypothetical protein